MNAKAEDGREWGEWAEAQLVRGDYYGNGLKTLRMFRDAGAAPDEAAMILASALAMLIASQMSGKRDEGLKFVTELLTDLVATYGDGVDKISTEEKRT